MPTKPSNQPEQWGTAGNYPASNYPATFPWGDPHPQAGLPTPWSGQPRTNASGLAGFASQGAVPLEAQAADLWNEEFTRVVELTRWVFLGSSSPDTDAHIVETDSGGSAGLYAIEVGNPVLFRSSSAIGQTEFVSGSVDSASGVPWTVQGAFTTSGQVTVNTNPIIVNAGVTLPAGQAITGTSTSTVTAGLLSAILRVQLGLGGTSTLNGQLFRDSNGFLRYSVSGSDAFVHGSAAGFARTAAVQEGDSGLLATVLVTTPTDIAPLASATMAVTATFQAQRSTTAGTITSQLQEDQGTSTWVDIGATQVDTITDDSDGNDWTTVTMARNFSADTTARFYRLRVTGGANNKVRSARVTVEVIQT